MSISIVCKSDENNLKKYYGHVGMWSVQGSVTMEVLFSEMMYKTVKICEKQCKNCRRAGVGEQYDHK